MDSKKSERKIPRLFNLSVEDPRLRGGFDEPVETGIVACTAKCARNIDEVFVGIPCTGLSRVSLGIQWGIRMNIDLYDPHCV